jgi:serine/threonine-protein kinase HipA
MIESGSGELGQQQAALISIGGSLGGAKPKAVVAIGSEEWVVKFFNGEPWDQPLIEHACMTMALKSKIHAAQTQVLKMKADNAIAVKRFDRIAGQRIHSISASTLIRAATPQGQTPQYGYPHLARRLRAVANINRLDEHLEDLFRRMVFNILIGNTDDHEKNHALTYEIQGGVPVVNLSKAYDIVTTGSGSTVHEFMIADDVVDPDLEAAISVHYDFGLDERRARMIVREIVLVVDQWKLHFGGLGVTHADIERLEEFIDSEHLLEQRHQHRMAIKKSSKNPRVPKRRTPGIFR